MKTSGTYAINCEKFLCTSSTDWWLLSKLVLDFSYCIFCYIYQPNKIYLSSLMITFVALYALQFAGQRQVMLPKQTYVCL